MSDLVTIALTGPAKIDGVIRAPGWSGEVSAEVAKQLHEAGVLAEALAAEDPGLVEPVADPRDELIERLHHDVATLRGDVTDLRGQIGVWAENASELSEKLVAALRERDQALARVEELAAQLAAQPSAEPAPAPTKKGKAST